ncbi:MAG: hypothetical protein ACI8ZO_001197 [Flavobacteriales bacterium]
MNDQIGYAKKSITQDTIFLSNAGIYYNPCIDPHSTPNQRIDSIGTVRAQGIKDYLVNLGLDKNKIHLRDRGNQRPVARELEDLRNRRVVFKFH